jgi:hypothetical protein
MSVESSYVASANGSVANGPDAASTGVAGPVAGLELIRRRPELLVGAAFAGGMVAAFLLRRLGH